MKKWQSAAIVVLASGGYPGSYRSGFRIHGLSGAEAFPDVHVIHAGTRLENDALFTAGGRVLGVVGQAESLAQALQSAYKGVGRIHFEGMQYRRDIGLRGLKALG